MKSRKFSNYFLKLFGVMTFIMGGGLIYKYFFPDDSLTSGDVPSLWHLYLYVPLLVIIGYILLFRTAYVECHDDFILIQRFTKKLKLRWDDVKAVIKIPFCSPPLYRMSFKKTGSPVYFDISANHYFVESPILSWGWDTSGFLDYARSKIK